ncbi:MAG: energy transducer TonB [Candidatus Eremiobacteraeota bacterium]|nr:energy transducer TonB [Candidatus Eremiobacteraeota bacterium]
MAADNAFALQVSAQAPKTVSGKIIVLTSSAFYSIPLPRQSLVQTVIMISLNGKPVRKETVYQSQPIYFALPQKEAVQAAWITDIAEDDKPAECATLPFAAYAGNVNQPYSTSGGLAARDVRAEAPAKMPLATFLKRLDMNGCDKVVTEARMIDGVSPAYPLGEGPQRTTVIVKIALNAVGTVADAAILQSGGNDAFDASAMNASIHSRYAPKQFLCTPVPGFYSFRANFGS